MKTFVVLSALLVAASANYCYNDVEGACSTKPSKNDGKLANCNAKYGEIAMLEAELQAYANAQIATSFEFLLMSTHFGNYESNREGFQGLYRKLSDKAWDDAFDVIKFIAKRGGTMNFNQHFKGDNAREGTKMVEVTELTSLAKALDAEKHLATQALRIHAEAQHHTRKHDASVAHYIEERFVEPQAECIRTLAGHTNDLTNLLRDRDSKMGALSIHLFDEYLKKTL